MSSREEWNSIYARVESNMTKTEIEIQDFFEMLFEWLWFNNIRLQYG